MFKHPNYCPYDKKEQSSDGPHLDREWLQKGPSTRVLPLNRGKDHKPRRHIWLSEINNLCSICDDSYIAYHSIKVICYNFIDKLRIAWILPVVPKRYKPIRNWICLSGTPIFISFPLLGKTHPRGLFIVSPGQITS